jgi:hypothetical protein
VQNGEATPIRVESTNTPTSRNVTKRVHGSGGAGSSSGGARPKTVMSEEIRQPTVTLDVWRERPVKVGHRSASPWV